MIAANGMHMILSISLVYSKLIELVEPYVVWYRKVLRSVTERGVTFIMPVAVNYLWGIHKRSTRYNVLLSNI